MIQYFKESLLLFEYYATNMECLEHSSRLVAEAGNVEDLGNLFGGDLA